jgi:hypothetical protein
MISSFTYLGITSVLRATTPHDVGPLGNIRLDLGMDICSCKSPCLGEVDKEAAIHISPDEKGRFATNKDVVARSYRHRGQKSRRGQLKKSHLQQANPGGRGVECSNNHKHAAAQIPKASM